jgi:hypothetical protein
MIPARSALSVAGAMYLHPHLATEHMRSTQDQRLSDGAASRMAAEAAKPRRSRILASRSGVRRRTPAAAAQGGRQHA